jgi:hypothetical protein
MGLQLRLDWRLCGRPEIITKDYPEGKESSWADGGFLGDLPHTRTFKSVLLVPPLYATHPSSRFG